MPTPPSQSDYTLTEVLAVRAASWVQRAVRAADAAPVVIKGVSGETATPLDIARVRYEHKILEHLHASNTTPGIIRPLALLGREEDTRLVLEDVGGYALSVARDKQQVPLTLADVLFIAEQVVLALQHVHQAQVIHKDINPSNIVYNAATRRVQLVDFGIASRFDRELQQAVSLRTIEGTLAYIAPEQTGRMNRFIDYRADFYALGATLYDLLGGTPPFGAGGDIAEVVHAVLSKTPTPLEALAPQVPPMVAAVVQRLMEKTPERRYQSAHGILADLRRCREELQASGRIAPFVLGQQERHERFELPQRLYGRQPELAALHAAWDRAATGSREMLFLAGPSGIGKTALAADLQQDMLRHKAIFVSGKHDQLSRALPFSAFSQAIAAFVHMLLSEPEEELEVWRRRLRNAVGNVGQALADIAPAIELLLGKQKPIAVLPAQESEARLLMLLQRFTEALVEKRPLVLFLDDLQWADSGTLKLLRAIFSSPTPMAGLMIIGAYRDNEVAAEHPLALCMQDLERAGVAATSVRLQPLRQEDTAGLISDALGSAEGADAQALARLVTEKTGGNPFFMREFLRHLHSQRLLTFDLDAQAWRWDLGAIRAAAVTDNVIELMTDKLHSYAPRAQQLLSVAACLGNEFHLDDLHALCGLPRANIAEALVAPLAAGLLMPVGRGYRYAADTDDDVSYRFAHDRVQQAAFELLDGPAARQWHGRIGRHLRAQLGDERDARLFSALSHLNAAVQDMQSDEERLELARLNVRGAREAKRSAVYQVAVDYLQVAFALLGDERWSAQPSLTREAELEMADALFLMGRAAEAARHLDDIVAHSRTDLERAEVQSRRVNALTAVGQWTEALDVGFATLRALRADLPRAPSMLQIGLELVAAKIDLRPFDVDTLHLLPRARERRIIVAFETIGSMAIPAFYESDKLVAIACLHTLRLTLRHGTSPHTGFDFAKMVILNVQLNDYAEAKRYSRLVTLFNDANADALGRAAAQFTKVAFIDWVDLGPEALAETLRQVYLLGLEVGDPLFGGWGAVYSTVASLPASLPQCDQDTQTYAGFITSRAEPQQLASWREVRQLARLLRGQTAGPHDWSTADYAPQAMWDTIQKIGGPTLSFCTAMRMMGAWLHGDLAAQAQLLDVGAAGMVLERAGEQAVMLYCIFGSLACMTLQRAHGRLPGKHRRLLRRLRGKLRAASREGATHYGGFEALLEAEAADLRGQGPRAMALYARANTAMMASEYAAYRAIALECAGRFYARRALWQPARQNLQQARDTYHRWGAETKVRQLEAEFHKLAVAPRMLANAAASGHTLSRPATLTAGQVTSTTARIADAAIDLPALMAMAQSLASETSLQGLARAAVDSLRKISGASRAALITFPGDAAQTLADSAGAGQAPPEPAVQYVRRAQEPLHLETPQAVSDFLKGAGGALPQTLLCLPALHHGALQGVIYLDNGVIANVFTPERMTLIKLLSTQIAISLANGQMVNHLEEQVTERSRRLKEVSERLSRLQTEALENQMAGGFAHEMRNALSGAAYALQMVVPMPNHPRDGLDFLLDGLAEAVEMLEAKPGAAALRRVQEQTERLREALDEVAHGIGRGLGLTSLILDYAQSAQIVAGHDAVDLSALVDSVLAGFSGKLARQNIQVRRDGTDAAPAYIREAHARTILRNLIANAHDALEAQEPGAARELSVAVRQESGQIVVTVADTGVGMSEATRHRVFEPFFSTKGSKGTGLGLGLSRKLADVYGGKLEFESEENRGATFRVALPSVKRP